jgi:hypothetical protein
MKAASWQASLTASQAGENSQTNGLNHTIESSILTDLKLRKNTEKEWHCKKHPQTSKEVQFNLCASKFKWIEQLHQLQDKPRSWILKN